MTTEVELGLPERSVPYCEIGASPLAKAIIKAFLYHPHGLNNVIFTTNHWCLGPTFAVTVDDDVEIFIRLSEGYRLYRDTDYRSPLLGGTTKEEMRRYFNFEFLENLASGCTETLTLDTKGHSKPPEPRQGKFGESVAVGTGKCTCRALRPSEGPVLLEMGFPLVQLYKRIGGITLRGLPTPVVQSLQESTENKTPTFPYTMSEYVVAYDSEDTPCGLFIAKRVGDRCDV